MNQTSVAVVVAELKFLLRRISRALQTGGPAPARKKFPESWFGEYEQVERAKFHPAAAPLHPEAGRLPESYGLNRLVVQAVDSERVYAYWELAPRQGAGRGRLRFHPEGGPPFDVEVDLAAGGAYVPLWSPDRGYGVELIAGSSPLARSKRVHTPRPWPVPRSAERFVRLSAGEPGAEPLRAARPPAGAAPPLSAAPAPADLTALAEERLTPGVSSDPLNRNASR